MKNHEEISRSIDDVEVYTSFILLWLFLSSKQEKYHYRIGIIKWLRQFLNGITEEKIKYLKILCLRFGCTICLLYLQIGDRDKMTYPFLSGDR
jgi:hypothetical protein